jgi:hypothetical protein
MLAVISGDLDDAHGLLGGFLKYAVLSHLQNFPEKGGINLGREPRGPRMTACRESGSGRIWIPHPGKKGGFRLFALTVATFSLQVSEDLLNHI